MIRSRIGAIWFSCALLLLVLSPVVQNWRERPQDSFPLSYYPMFSRERQDLVDLHYVVATDETGVRHHVPYRYIGNGGLNQVRRQLRRLISRGYSPGLARELHEKLRGKDAAPWSSIDRVEVITGKFSLGRYMAGEREPLAERVHAVYESPSKEDIVLAQRAAAEARVVLVGFGNDVPNGFAGSSLARFIEQSPGAVAGALGNLEQLLDSRTDLGDYATIDRMRLSFPRTTRYLNHTPTNGAADLLQTVWNSPKVANGSSAYDRSVHAERGVKALRVDLPETRTTGGTYVPSESLAAVGSRGEVEPIPASHDFARQGYELAILDTNVKRSGLENGGSDDFGLVVEVGRVAERASVRPGELLFLTFAGGVPGEDIDTVDIDGDHQTIAILLDLDPLQRLGCETIRRLFVVDAGTGGTLNVMEVISLAVAQGVDAR